MHEWAIIMQALTIFMRMKCKWQERTARSLTLARENVEVKGFCVADLTQITIYVWNLPHLRSVFEISSGFVMESNRDIEVVMSIKDLSLALQKWVRLPQVGYFFWPGRTSLSTQGKRSKTQQSTDHAINRRVNFDCPQTVRLDQVISLPSTASPNACMIEHEYRHSVETRPWGASAVCKKTKQRFPLGRLQSK